VIILPWRGVVVAATPRTGSRAIKAAIISGVRAHESPVVTRIHHEFPREIVQAAKDGQYEIWTLTREPISQLKSWLSHATAWNDPLEFIQNFNSRYFMHEGGMNIYGRTATRFFVYEKDGHNKLIKALGLLDVEIPVIGSTLSSERSLTEEQTAAAERRFKYDFELYQDILDGKR
jgi:hypothetical protein